MLMFSMSAALMLCRTYTNQVSSTLKASSITISEWTQTLITAGIHLFTRLDQVYYDDAICK